MAFQLQKKTCCICGTNPRKQIFAVSTTSSYTTATPGYVTTWEYVDGFVSDTFKLLKEHKESPPLSIGVAYKESVLMNEKKMADIKKIMASVTGEQLEFYYHVISWNTTNAD